MRKEFLELRMNPRLFGLVIIAPILQLTMLGYAATTDVKNVPLLVADGDRSAASRELVARFDASPNFTVVDMVTTVSEIEPYLERGTASLALSIPAGYGASIGDGRPVKVQVVADGTDSNSTDGRARLRDEPDRRLRSGPRGRVGGWRRGRADRRFERQRPAGDRCAHPRLVQSRSSRAATS